MIMFVLDVARINILQLAEAILVAIDLNYLKEQWTPKPSTDLLNFSFCPQYASLDLNMSPVSPYYFPFCNNKFINLLALCIDIQRTSLASPFPSTSINYINPVLSQPKAERPERRYWRHLQSQTRPAVILPDLTNHLSCPHRADQPILYLSPSHAILLFSKFEYK